MGAVPRSRNTDPQPVPPWALWLSSLVVLGGIAAIGLSCSTASEYEPVESVQVRFERACAAEGGFVVVKQPPGFFGGGQLACIVDNEVLYLPGFAQ